MAEVAIYMDTSKCTSCKGCQVACKCWNNLPSSLEFNAGEFTGNLQNPPDLADNTRLIITHSEKKREGEYGVDWAFGRRACMHCTDAGCVNVCPSGCLYHDEETGLVAYHVDKCIGCEYCVSACPFDVPRHTHTGAAAGNVVINKCTGCIDRVKQGRKPACVSTCQPGALQFGPREEMLQLGRDRVEELKAKGFESAQLYGEDQMGGLHSVTVLKYPIDQYTLPENPQANPMTAVGNFMKPLAGVGVAALLGGLGLSYATGIGYKRDEMRYDEDAHDIIDVEKGEIMRHINVEEGER